MSREFTKHGTIKATDSDRRIAHGVALVPNEVDHQGDWLAPAAVERLADDYMQRLSAGRADQGVMHVKFEDSDLSLAESRVLDSPDTIGDDQYPAGTWELGFKVHDDDLWNLVAGDNPVLSGFSIGGAVDARSEQALANLPEGVVVPDDVELDGMGATEIIDGKLREVSLVDLPAVPRARVATIKSLADLEKAIDPAMTHDEIVEQLDGRGLDESQRARLASYLKKTVSGNGTSGEDYESRMSTHTASGRGTDTDGDEPLSGLDKEDIGLLKSFTKGLKSAFSGSSDAEETKSESDTEKDGRTHSNATLNGLMAIHDAAEQELSRQIDFRTNRFTDDPMTDFDLGEFGKAKAMDTDADVLEIAKDVGTKQVTADDVDPSSGTASVGDAVRWASDAGGSREPDEVRYGVVINGLQDGPEDMLKVAVYQPTSDGEGWENRNEDNDMNQDNLEPVGSDGVGSLPPVDQVKAQPFDDPAEPGSDSDTNTDTDNKTMTDTERLDRIEQKLDELTKSDTDDDAGGDDDTRADGVEADGEADSDEVEDGTRADGVDADGEPDSPEVEDGTRADGVEDDDDDEDKAKSADEPEEPPEWAKQLSEDIQQNQQNIESLAKSSGRSHQLTRKATGEDGEDDVDENERKAAFMGF